MALDIRQTVALPADHTQVDPSTFLEAWISGIQVFNLPAGAFAAQTQKLQFVVTATDPPATAERTEGMLWFKRGEGRLFIWDPNDVFGGTSSYSAVTSWMSISDRRDIWVEAVGGTALGSPLTLIPLTQTTRISNDPSFDNFNKPSNFRALWRCAALNNTAAGQPHPSEFMVVALDTAVSNALTVVRACELGFCDMRVGSGVSGSSGWATIVSAGTTEPDVSAIDNWSMLITAASEVQNTMLKGFYTDSSATNPGTQYLRPAFLIANPPLGMTYNN